MVLILSNRIYVNANFHLEILLLNIITERADSCFDIEIQGKNLFRHSSCSRKHVKYKINP